MGGQNENVKIWGVNIELAKNSGVDMEKKPYKKHNESKLNLVVKDSVTEADLMQLFHGFTG